MWKNYLKVAIRNSWKNKTYLSINVIGLGISMAFCLTIYLLYAYNWEFDNYYSNTSSIFRISELKQNTGRGLSRYDLAPMPMGPRVVQEIAGVESQTRFMLYGENMAREDQVNYESVGYVDNDFFKMFPIGLKSGPGPSLKIKAAFFSPNNWQRNISVLKIPSEKALLYIMNQANASIFRWPEYLTGSR